MFEQSFNKLLDVNLNVDLVDGELGIRRNKNAWRRTYYNNTDLMGSLENTRTARQIRRLCIDNNITFIQEDVSNYIHIRTLVDWILKSYKDENKLFNIIIDEHNMNINLCELEINSEKVFLTLKKYYDELNNEFGSNKICSLKK